jgi:hypothetical protein
VNELARRRGVGTGGELVDSLSTGRSRALRSTSPAARDGEAPTTVSGGSAPAGGLGEPIPANPPERGAQRPWDTRVARGVEIPHVDPRVRPIRRELTRWARVPLNAHRDQFSTARALRCEPLALHALQRVVDGLGIAAEPGGHLLVGAPVEVERQHASTGRAGATGRVGGRDARPKRGWCRRRARG